MTYTVEQVEEAIREYEEMERTSDYGTYNEDFWENISWYRDPVMLPRLGEAERVTTHGGGEGDGEYMDVIFKIGDQLFRKTGYHNSWDSNDWDGELEEVEAFEKTVTDYRAV